jgi:signal transduction histidine kinase
MFLLEISIQSRVIIGISAMVLLFSSFLIAFISYQRKKLQYHKELHALQEAQQRALQEQNAQLEQHVAERTAQLVEQKEKLQATLAELKASQLQLIQKEKMASFGELTAGIAHEIQNPLNFVNNFAEINTELLSSLQERITEDNLSEELRKDLNPIVADLTENLSKIVQHGRRADNIVKNMLQHSRKQSGAIEHTDINLLTEEYIKLSYHGFKAKNKMFNCTINTSFDNSIEKMNVVPEDIGRLLINLLNNAFYSLKEKIKLKGNDYHPAVNITTKKKGNKIELTIRDNGMGISKKFIDKIYQPFFTTKPTGDGSGLGLSLSYDIIKAHQGELKAISEEEEFAQFTIELDI